MCSLLGLAAWSLRLFLSTCKYGLISSSWPSFSVKVFTCLKGPCISTGSWLSSWIGLCRVWRMRVPGRVFLAPFYPRLQRSIHGDHGRFWQHLQHLFWVYTCISRSELGKFCVWNLLKLKIDSFSRKNACFYVAPERCLPLTDHHPFDAPTCLKIVLRTRGGCSVEPSVMFAKDRARRDGPSSDVLSSTFTAPGETHCIGPSLQLHIRIVAWKAVTHESFIRLNIFTELHSTSEASKR